MRPAIDLAGQSFGDLTVIKRVRRRTTNGEAVWLCVCVCGRTIGVRGSYLRNGSARHCGCQRPKPARSTAAPRRRRLNGTVDRRGRRPLNLTGQRFGALRAMRPTRERSGHAVVWLCWCDCGRQHKVAAQNLRHGMTKSCGCRSHLRPVDGSCEHEHKWLSPFGRALTNLTAAGGYWLENLSTKACPAPTPPPSYITQAGVVSRVAATPEAQ